PMSWLKLEDSGRVRSRSSPASFVMCSSMCDDVQDNETHDCKRMPDEGVRRLVLRAYENPAPDWILVTKATAGLKISNERRPERPGAACPGARAGLQAPAAYNLAIAQFQEVEPSPGH